MMKKGNTVKNKLTPVQIDALSEYMAEDILDRGGDIGPMLAHYFYLMITGEASEPLEQKVVMKYFKQMKRFK